LNSSTWVGVTAVRRQVCCQIFRAQTDRANTRRGIDNISMNLTALNGRRHTWIITMNCSCGLEQPLGIIIYERRDPSGVPCDYGRCTSWVTNPQISELFK